MKKTLLLIHLLMIQLLKKALVVKRERHRKDLENNLNHLVSNGSKEGSGSGMREVLACFVYFARSMINECPYNRDVWNKTACTRLRLQSIIDHEKTAAHRDCIKLESAAVSSQNIAIAFNPEVSALGIEQAFSCFLVKQRIAHTTNYEPLLNLMAFLGNDIKSRIHVAKNATYLSDKSIQEMVYILSEVIETKVLSEMQDSDHFALLLDETSDCTVTEQLAIHGRPH